MSDTGNTETKRLFAALELDENVRHELAAAVAIISSSGAHVRWVPESNLHLSLFFLGNTPASEVNGIQDVLDAEAEQTIPFQFEVSSIGFFGRKHSPRVIWAGVEAVSELMSLQERLSVRMESLGYKADRRAYKPHITLGRVKSGGNKKGLIKAMNEFKAISFGTVYTESCVLMESVLGPDGARYSMVHRAGFSK